MILTLSDIKINYDFENLIPRQTADQFRQMEENLIAEGGAHDPLVIWEGHDILLDGHHRLRVLKAHPELSWYPKYVSLTDEEEAKEWIVKTALGKRNLTPNQWQELAGRFSKMRKRRVGNPNARSADGKFQSSEKSTNGTAEAIAKELGVSRTAVFEAENYVDGLDTAEAAVPGIADRVRSGELPAQKKEVREWRRMTPEQIKASEEHIKERGSKKRKPEDRALTENIKDAEKSMYSASVTKYDLSDLLNEIDALGDSFINSLSTMIARRSSIVESYSGGAEMVREHIETIITKIKDMKKGFGYV